MTDTKLAEASINALLRSLGVTAPLPVEEAVQLAAFLVSKLRGASWSDAIAAGVDAQAAIKTEADAEASRRARMGDR